MRVADVMTTGAETVSADASLIVAARKMRDFDIGFLPVVENDIVVGVVTDRDITLRGLGEGRIPELTSVGEVMTPSIVACHKNHVLTEAAEIMEEHQVRRLLVLDDHKRLVGLLSLDDLAAQMSSDRLLGTVLRGVTKTGNG
jgi:CBS domain-containing protein